VGPGIVCCIEIHSLAPLHYDKCSLKLYMAWLLGAWKVLVNGTSYKALSHAHYRLGFVGYARVIYRGLSKH